MTKLHRYAKQSNIQDTLLYVQVQSMRSNLVFTNIKESINERHKDCEVKLRQFIVEKLGVAQYWLIVSNSSGSIELVFLVVLPALDRQH